MRRVTAFVSVAAVVLMAASVVAQGKASFAGEWKKAADPDGGGARGGPGVDLTITQTATAMTVEFRPSSQAPAPVKLTYDLSKAIWAANKLVVTTTTSAGEEKRTFAMDGDTLVVETSAPGRNGSAASTTKATYKRYQRGFGG
jgi:hypothetical protein